MLTRDDAENFSRRWAQAWNDRDLDMILTFYSEDVVFHSPRIMDVLDSDTPYLTGKSALNNYWSLALDDAREIFFEIDDIFISSDGLTLTYANHRSQQVAETFIFDEDGKIREAVVAYK
ncbi:MAG: hypothetical protein CME88_01515 [Hirschia sp.]|nr:hypothetical protein [Hirschia sp.]MBF17039.1 hypothetical protein [Hirschia sp.]|tara:strand:+ start:804 stop:1160 length:357 start_codon:yes stop_codon:yes gene_type:complete